MNCLPKLLRLLRGRVFFHTYSRIYIHTYMYTHNLDCFEALSGLKRLQNATTDLLFHTRTRSTTKHHHHYSTRFRIRHFRTNVWVHYLILFFVQLVSWTCLSIAIATFARLDSRVFHKQNDSSVLIYAKSLDCEADQLSSNRSEKDKSTVGEDHTLPRRHP